MVLLQHKISSKRKAQVMSRIEADQCENKLAGRRQEIPKKY